MLKEVTGLITKMGEEIEAFRAENERLVGEIDKGNVIIEGQSQEILKLKKDLTKKLELRNVELRLLGDGDPTRNHKPIAPPFVVKNMLAEIRRVGHSYFKMGYWQSIRSFAAWMLGCFANDKDAMAAIRQWRDDNDRAGMPYTGDPWDRRVTVSKLASVPAPASPPATGPVVNSRVVG